MFSFLNLQMRGSGATPKAPLELSSSMMEKRLIDQNPHLSIKSNNREPLNQYLSKVLENLIIKFVPLLHRTEIVSFSLLK